MIDLEKLWNEKLEGRAWQLKEEFIKLLNLMIKENVKSVLEIGCYKGGTALAFLELGCEVVSIDPSPQPEALELINLYPKFTFIEKDSKEVSIDYMSDFDMLWIDGDHSYDYVKHDYDKFFPHVKTGGLIAFHDIVNSQLHRQQECEVPKFWNELLVPNVEAWEFVTDGTWGGIGVIRKF